jgi:outer membrane protein TolC
MKRGHSIRVAVCVAALFLSAYLGDSSAEVLTLSQGLKLAAEKNRVIKITQQQERMSEADTLIAKSALLPNVNAYASQTFLSYQPQAIFGAVTVPTSEKSFASYSLGVQQLLYDFERSSSRYKASQAVLETKRLDTLRVRNQVSLDFALVYFDLLESEKLVLVAQKEVESVSSHLRDAGTLYENGVITKNDLLQAEVRLSDARQRLLNVKNLRAINASRLNTVLSRPLSTDIEVVDLASTPSEHGIPDREGAWDAALQLRPEMRITDETMRSLDLEEKSKKAEFYPRFFAGASYDYTENRFMVHQGNVALVLGMDINLFSGGSTKAELAKTEHRKVQLLEQRARLADEIRLEVEKNILDLRNAQERIKVAKDAVGQAQENLRINRVRYEEGVGTATEVLDAVTLLTVAETNYYRSLYDFRRAESAVFYSMGKDLSEVYR